MKKLMIAILVFMLAIQAFAKQICMKFAEPGAETEIQKIIDAGYKVVTMTYGNVFHNVIVVFEKEDEQ